MVTDSILYWNKVALDGAPPDFAFTKSASSSPQHNSAFKTTVPGLVHLAMHDTHLEVINRSGQHLAKQLPRNVSSLSQPKFRVTASAITGPYTVTSVRSGEFSEFICHQTGKN